MLQVFRFIMSKWQTGCWNVFMKHCPATTEADLAARLFIPALLCQDVVKLLRTQMNPSRRPDWQWRKLGNAPLIILPDRLSLSRLKTGSRLQPRIIRNCGCDSRQSRRFSRAGLTINMWSGRSFIAQGLSPAWSCMDLIRQTTPRRRSRSGRCSKSCCYTSGQPSLRIPAVSEQQWN